MKKFFPFGCSLFFYVFSFSQTERCGSQQMLQQILQNEPDAANRLQQHRSSVKDYLASSPNGSRHAIVTIPVVFHIVHSGEALGNGKNIADAQAHSQIQVLNNCFGKRNADTALIPNWFKSRAVDVQIEFCLATYDPSGNVTSGITRHNIPNIVSFDNDVKPITQWDPAKYLNIWTTGLGTTLLGYATFPNMFPWNQEGVVVDYRHLGKISGNPYNSPDTLGRTCVHEVGHFLGLYHTFQDSCTGMTSQTCDNSGDWICDTPPEGSATYGNPSLNQNTCHETPVDEFDMWMNYMDYVDDKNLLMFTYDQRDAMHAVLHTTRLSLISSTGCTNVANTFSLSGKVIDAQTSANIDNAKVLFDGPLDFEASTDANGNFTIPNLVEGYYDVYAGKWGYKENFFASHGYYFSGITPPSIPLQNHYYYDDFLFDFNWNTAGSATSGSWTRGIPIGGYYQNKVARPDLDALDDYGLKCFVTGNSNQNAATENVNNGSVTLVSPVFDGTVFNDPYIRVNSWFFDGSQNGSPPDDNITFRVSDGTSTVTMAVYSDTAANYWSKKTFRISNFIIPTATMRFTVLVADAGNQNVVEAAIDKFEVLDAVQIGIAETKNEMNVSLYPNPATEIVQLHFNLEKESRVNITVLNILGEEVFSEKNKLAEHTTLSFDFSSFPKGVYLVHLQTDDSEKILKLVLR